MCELLLSEQARLEQKDTMGRTPLVLASMEGHLGVVEHFVSKQADVEAQDKEGLKLKFALRPANGVRQLQYTVSNHKRQTMSVDQCIAMHESNDFIGPKNVV